MTPPTRDEIAGWLDLDRVDYEQGWEAGYRAGYQTGHDVGYGRAHHQLDEAWRALAQRVVRIGTGKLQGVLAEIRDQPHGHAWQEFRDRHGRDYQGGPVDWDTGRPAQPNRGAA